MVNLKKILQTLRVPELPYASRFDAAINIDTEGMYSFFLNLPVTAKKYSVLEELLKSYPDKRFDPSLINSCYLSDRAFDSWKRKANLDDLLEHKLSKWRFIFVGLLCNTSFDLKSLGVSEFLHLINEIQQSQIGWTATPENIAKPLLKFMDKLDSVMFNQLIKENDYLAEIGKEWGEFQIQNQHRVSKILQRLIPMEMGLARSTWAESIAWTMLYEGVRNKQLPIEFQEFLLEYWYSVIKAHLLGIDRNTETTFSFDRVKQLTLKMIWIFTQPNKTSKEKLYSYSEDLIENILNCAAEVSITLMPASVESLEFMLVTLLREGELDYASPAMFDENRKSEGTVSNSMTDKLNFDQSFINFEEPSYYFKKNEPETRFLIVGKIEFTQSLLAVNHAGIKLFTLSEAEFKQRVSDQDIKALPTDFSLERVLLDILRGLGKVAKVQTEAREKAKQKARKEAESIVIAKRKAKRLAAKQDAERILKLQQAKDEATKQQKIEQIKEVAEKVDTLTLGAWVEFIFEDEEPIRKEKYKLAVKINSSQKFIFTDRYGLKRHEIVRKTLVEQVLKSTARIVTQGENTSDTLERVVGRIRLGR